MRKPLLILPLLMFASVSQAQKTEEFLQEYCLKCHNYEDWAGSLEMESLDLTHAERDAEIWELVLRKLEAGMMPPTGEEHPAHETAESFISLVEQSLDEQVQVIPANPDLPRLNRSEYANAVRDLLALDINAAELLPTDDSVEGFDNIASGLNISPALVQGYVAAAMKISRSAVGDSSLQPSVTSYDSPPGFEQSEHLEGLPLGTRGGMAITHNFPLDGDYVFSAGTGFGRSNDIQYDFTLDGEQIQVSNPREFTLTIPAGKHTLTVAIVDVRRPAGVNDIYSGYSQGGQVSSVSIDGPYKVTGLGNTESREQIFVCYPANVDEVPGCARKILATLANKAFRVPVTPEAIPEVVEFFNRGYDEGGFETGIQQGLARILIDPRFLFRFEEEPEGLSAGDIYRISDLELASRLSFFLWSSIPDDTLIDLAVSGQLHEPQVLHEQVSRMLGDARAVSFVENFAGQWLFLRQLKTLSTDAAGFNDNLREDFMLETQLLFRNVVESDAPVTELIDPDYTFINERLARHYGIHDVYGSYFRRVALEEDSPRRGLLGQGSILTITSTASRTSPVIRGSWILENLLHAPVPAPPPGVETNLDGDGNVALTDSVRERLESHRANPACASCHAVMDPIGFALENFDLIGAWRTLDGTTPVDSSGTLVDGTPLNGPADLRSALMEKRTLFVTAMTQKLFTYALGRKLEYFDMPTVRQIVHSAETDDYRFQTLVNGIVGSLQFQHRVAKGESRDDEGNNLASNLR